MIANTKNGKKTKMCLIVHKIIAVIININGIASKTIRNMIKLIFNSPFRNKI